MKYKNLLQSLAKFMEKFTQLLASISLFSFLFSYFSSYFSSFFTYYYSLNFSFSTFPFQLLSHAMDKKYVFLLCNGIFLVLLANTSNEEEKEEEKVEEDGFLNEFLESELPLCIGAHASYLETSKEEVHVRQHEDEMSIQLGKFHEVPLNVENSIMTIVEYKQDEATSESHEVLDKEKENGSIGDEKCSTTYEIVEADDCEENDFFSEEEEVEESDEPLNKLSTEDLNKKFEEFIKKMKEEIRIEARQQLVLVK
ncbi:uncharacterized protein LOC129892426 [Solanum dulcamara]|uniref:uncharacterized protein LOC129892426 n=1 Tax=Solanum dulcamara TaxID=45834 RepID=UPI0024867AD4|nr:uncharacterized protein LOC129892426 [Solanum dulcamara]